jgi:hypothetical protein
MENQLHLRITTDSTPTPDWRLDASAKEVGRSGIALARAALEQARRSRTIAPSIDAPEGERPEDPTGTDHRDLDHTTAA